MNLSDLCCGVSFPIGIIISTVFILYLRKSSINFKIRGFLYSDDEAVAVISRTIALAVPLIIVTIFHVCNAFGMDIWSPLLSISVALALILSGAVILVLGLKVGFYYPIILIFVIWILCIYVYVQFEANII